MPVQLARRVQPVVYRERRDAFVRVATQLTGDEQSGQDVVQEAFARALRRRRSFRRSGALEAWLWRVVVNAAHDTTRKRTDVPMAVLPESTSSAPEVSSRAELLRSQLAALPERQRIVLFLRYYADLDHKAIAAALRIRPGTVGSTLSAAHAALEAITTEVERR